MARPRRRPFAVRLLALGASIVAARLLLFVGLRVASGSMEPLLHGDPESGDSLLVARQLLVPGAPRRLDLVVFERADDGARSEERLTVKRVAAVGGESIRIDDGELFVRGAGSGSSGIEQQVVKRYAQFKSLLVPLWREPFDGGVTERLRLLDRSAEASRVAVDGRALRIDGAPDRVELGLADGVVDYDDGWLDERGRRHPGTEPVNDVLFALDLTFDDELAGAVLGFAANGQRFSLELTPLAGSYRATLELKQSGQGPIRVVHAETAPVRVGKRRRVELWQVDGRVGAALDGEVVLDEPRDPEPVALTRDHVADVSLAVHHGHARLDRFEVWRDLHWTQPPESGNARADQPFEVPAGSLFVLGDASAQSIDSRTYGAIPESSLRGRPLLVQAPFARWRWLW